MEQLPFGLWGLADRVRKFPKENAQIQVYCHNRDFAESSPLFVPSVEKPHFHILIMGVRAGKKDYKFVVNKMMAALGIRFRPGLDDELWANRGCETIADYTGYTVYMTHETKEALENGRKFTYDLEKMYENGLQPLTLSWIAQAEGILVSNMSLDEIRQLRAGYVRVGESRLSMNELAKLDSDLFNLGYNFGNLDEFINGLPFIVRSHSKRKTLEESYFRGLSERLRIDKDTNNGLGRICIFIKGTGGSGKTYSALNALDGKVVLKIEGGHTGKFDDLRPYTEAILVSDDTLPNALVMCDDYPCKAYKRGKNNQVWAGKYVVVTSNLEFDEWLEECGFKQQSHFDAMLSRFFICHMERKNDKWALVCDEVMTRGTRERRQNAIDEFCKFQKKFNAVCNTFIPASDNELSYAELNVDEGLSEADKKLHLDYACFKRIWIRWAKKYEARDYSMGFKKCPTYEEWLDRSQWWWDKDGNPLNRYEPKGPRGTWWYEPH